MSTLQVTMLRPASRMGLKGPDAAALLQQAGIRVPSAPNRIALSPAPPDSPDTAPVRVLRLGNAEFILEHDERDTVLARVQALARSAELRAWPVARADCSLLLSGAGLFDHLSRICAFDFAQLAVQPDIAVMTLLADISVTFTLEPGGGEPQLRLWADPGFATYLIQTLQSLSHAPSLGAHA